MDGRIHVGTLKISQWAGASLLALALASPAYAEDGSVVHFVSDRAIKVRLTVAELEPMLGAVAEIARSSVRESFMLR